jgi:hypothetical protein
MSLAEIWAQIYPKAIANYTTMSEQEQSDARQVLREKARWRSRVIAVGAG